MLIEKCPHCNTSHVQTELRFGENIISGIPFPAWRVLRCQNPACRKLILIAVRNDKEDIVGMYPAGSYELSGAIKISQEIRDDFREAGLCHAAGCDKASMVMSRRVLQRCLKEQGCTQRNLVDAIDDAMGRGILRKNFHAVATEIRQYGNLGAHPDDEQLQNITTENALQVLEFARLLIHEFYEIPAVADKLRKQREGQPSAPDSR